MTKRLETLLHQFTSLKEDAVAAAELKAKQAEELERLKTKHETELEALTDRHERESERQKGQDEKEVKDDQIKAKRDADRKANEERDYKKEYANYHSKPDQIKRRAKRNEARRSLKDRKDIKGKDVHHKDNNPMNNDKSNLSIVSQNYNRKEPRLREEDSVEEGKYVSDIGDIINVIFKKLKDKLESEYKRNPEKGLGMINTVGAFVNHKVTDKKQQKNRLFLKFGDVQEVKQDKDIKDREGTQPSKYYAKDADGDEMSKSTKQKRAAHFAQKKDGPAPGDASAETKPSKHTKKFQKMFGEDAGKSLANKADKSGIAKGILQQVYNRGVAAWKTGHRPGTTPEQWGHARVNSFITKGKGTWGGADKDLAKKAGG